MERFKALPQLDFVSAVKLAAGRLLDFGGRSRRSEFWWWMAVILVVKVALGFVMPSHLFIPAVILDIVIMGCALSVTARRLQDAGYNAIWVHISYLLGIVTSVFPMLGKMPEFMAEYSMIIDRYGMNIKEAQVEALMEEYSGTLMVYGGLMLAWLITSLVVVVFCFLDSKPMTTKYGPSPKYVVEGEEAKGIEIVSQ